MVWNVHFPQWCRSHCVSGMLAHLSWRWSRVRSRLYSKPFTTSHLICSRKKILQLNNIFISSTQVLDENLLMYLLILWFWFDIINEQFMMLSSVLHGFHEGWDDEIQRYCKFTDLMVFSWVLSLSCKLLWIKTSDKWTNIKSVTKTRGSVGQDVRSHLSITLWTIDFFHALP